MIDWLFNILREYIDLPFLIGFVIFGYLIFFIYYYGSNAWHKVDWPERFLFGFIVGLASLFLLVGPIFVIIDFWFEKIEGIFPPRELRLFIYYMCSLFLVFILALKRQNCRGPLFSSRGKKMFIGYFQKNAHFTSYFLVLYILTIAISSLYIYPSKTIFDTWIGFLGGFLVAVILMVLGISLLIFLAFIPKTNAIPSMIRTYFISNPLEKIKVNLKKITLRKILTAAMLIGLVASIFVDANYAIIVPKIEAGQSQYSSSIEVIREPNRPVFGRAYADRWYVITSPYLPLIKNVTIENPSNISFLVYMWESSPTVTRLGGLKHYFLKNESNLAYAIRFKFPNSSRLQYNVSLNYRVQLSDVKLEIKEYQMDQTLFQNGTKNRRFIFLIKNNEQSRYIYASSSFAFVNLNDLNTTRIVFYYNNTIPSDHWYWINPTNDWLYSSFALQSGRALNITISINYV